MPPDLIGGLMLGRIYRIFMRYADRNLRLTCRGGALRDRQGKTLGTIDPLVFHDGRLQFALRSPAQTVQVDLAGVTAQGVLGSDPDALGGIAQFDLPFAFAPLLVTVTQDGTTADCHVPSFSKARIWAARFGLVGPFLLALICLVPLIYRWKWQGHLGAREAVKARLGLSRPTTAVGLSGGLFQPCPDPAIPPQKSPQGIRIILPVFDAFEVLQICLDRVLRHTDLDWHIWIVEDASSDVRVRDWLHDWVASPDVAGRASLLVNAQNLGFIGSVNRGFEALDLDDPRPVVLLNSDALVPAGWASRLVAPLVDPNVASVTPLSNDAEILNIPIIGRPAALAPEQGDALDAVCAAWPGGRAGVEVPTGIGFCMAMAPVFVSKIPQFDTIFGRGYGEETDWCQKTRALGGRHLALPGLFVEHRGGTSFGSAAKQRLLEKNLAVISQRYRRYDQQVQDFIRSDPLITPRLALALVYVDLLCPDHPVPVYLGHSMGGGAENWLAQRLTQDVNAVVIRVGQLHRWQIEVHTGMGVTAGLTDDTGVLQVLMDHLPRRRMVYSCGAGDHDMAGLPDVLCDLATPDGGLGVLVHDFLPISPSYTLLGGDGQYHGVPTAPDTQDAAHTLRRRDGGVTSLAQWQQAWGRLMRQADQIVTFSDSSADIVAQAYPEAAAQIVVQPHTVPDPLPVVPAAPLDGQGPVIGVLGNIGRHKGAQVVQTLCQRMTRMGRGRLVVIGEIDPAFPLARAGQVHGAYQLADVPGLVARYGISGWLIPSIWPETFSFTTHEVLATGLPVFTFDLGAQGDAARKAPNGHVLPLDQGAQIDPAALFAVLDKGRP